MVRWGREGTVREKGGFAAVWVAEEEDRDCGSVVHGQLPFFITLQLLRLRHCKKMDYVIGIPGQSNEYLRY